jgi:glycosyltransferase involved in cell wall biosynthesis
LVYVGEGDMLDELKSFAISEGVSDSVIFIGNQNQTTLAQLNTFASVIISPLTGRALSEAGLCGGAIVAYDLDWQGDIILNNKTGCLIPFREWENMAVSAMKLINNKPFADEMRLNLRGHALSMLNPADLDKYEIEAYTELIYKHYE